jgi:hypothetical protein
VLRKAPQAPWVAHRRQAALAQGASDRRRAPLPASERSSAAEAARWEAQRTLRRESAAAAAHHLLDHSGAAAQLTRRGYLCPEGLEAAAVAAAGVLPRGRRAADPRDFHSPEAAAVRAPLAAAEEEAGAAGGHQEERRWVGYLPRQCPAARALPRREAEVAVAAAAEQPLRTTRTTRRAGPPPCSAADAAWHLRSTGSAGRRPGASGNGFPCFTQELAESNAGSTCGAARRTST